MKFLRWIIATLLLLTGHEAALAQNWTSNNLSSLYARSIAMSADGAVLVMASGDNGANVSTNYGATWVNTPQTVTRYGGLATCSADGKKLFIGSGGALLACSTNAGQNWFFVTSNAPAMNSFIVASADGNTLVGGSDSGLFTSTNGGSSWRTNFTGAWTAAACSADGRKWIAGTSGRLVTSADFGITWKSNNVPNKSWSSVVSSADGNSFIAVAPASPQPLVYASTNGGTDWTASAAPMPYNTPRIVASADLHQLLYWLNPGLGYIYTSTNLGASWISNSVPLDSWTQGLSTADGNRLVLFKSQSMWVSTNTTPPSLNICPSGKDVLVSWLVPSVSLQVEQAQGGITEGWSPVTNTSIFIYSNLSYQITLSPTQASAFFRLSGSK